LAGWPPPGPPRFLGGFPDLRRRRRILSVPPGADRVPRVWTSIVTSTGLPDPRLPPPPMVSRTGFSPTSTLPPDTADGSSRSTATGRNDPDLLPPPAPRPAPPGLPRLDESTGVQGPHRLAAFAAGDGLPIKPYYQPVLPCRDRLLRGRFTGQNAYCTSPASSHGAGPPGLDDSPPSASCTAPPGPSRPIPPRPPRPGDSPDLPATYDRPFRPSSRSRSR
jgi:hypothetical protein